jgi:hypothetical protein
MNRIKAKDGKENLLQGLEHRTAGRLRARVGDRRRGHSLHRATRLGASVKRGADRRFAPIMLKKRQPIWADCRSQLSTKSAPLFWETGLNFSRTSRRCSMATTSRTRRSRGVRDSFWLQAMQCSIKGAYDCIKAFSETGLTEGLKKIDVPTAYSARRYGSDRADRRNRRCCRRSW